MTAIITLPAKVACVDCQMDNHGKCTGELWTSATPCECGH